MNHKRSFFFCPKQLQRKRRRSNTRRICTDTLPKTASPAEGGYSGRYEGQFSIVRNVSQVSHEILASVARRDWRGECLRGVGEGAGCSLPHRGRPAIAGDSTGGGMRCCTAYRRESEGSQLAVDFSVSTPAGSDGDSRPERTLDATPGQTAEGVYELQTRRGPRILESRLQAIERVASEGRGKQARRPAPSPSPTHCTYKKTFATGAAPG
jgi:hypothetical protein